MTPATELPTAVRHAPHAPSPSGDRIPRLIYLARILRLCGFPVATAILGVLVLLLVPQAQEALRAFGDGSQFWTQVIAFEVAFTLWMVSAWYVARLLLGKRFKPDLIGLCESPEFAKNVAEWLPRVIALIAGVPLAIYLLFQPHLGAVGVLLLATSGVVFAGLVFRRQIARRRGHVWVRRWSVKGAEEFEHYEGLSQGARWFIGALFAVSYGLLLGIQFGMESVARPIGSPALLLFALMSWTVFGGLVLTYLPKSYGTPAWTWILLPLVAVSALLNENHFVATHGGSLNSTPKPVQVAFDDWQRGRSDPQAPVIFIAAAGGASRAAYWTTSALGMLEDESHSQPNSLSGDTFLISGVSGGSVGAAAFVSALDLSRRATGSAAECRSVRSLANDFTGQDDLATVLGFFLFPDLLQRFLPVPVKSWDRSRGLEEVWVRDWDRIASRCFDRGPAPNPWAQPLTGLYDRPGPSELPLLALNTTAMNAGQLVLQANFQLTRADIFQIFASPLATRTLTLAEAVHNSARFPFVSPAGVVRMSSAAAGQGQSGGVALKYWDRLGDGGYMEASGAFTVAEVIRELERAGRIRRDMKSAGPCPKGEQGACYISWDQVRVLIVDNAPTDGSSYLCGAGASAASQARPIRAQNFLYGGSRFWPPVPDASAPLFGAFNTQSGRGQAAAIDLLSLVGECTDRFAELRLPESSLGNNPSMSWMLDADSRNGIDTVLRDPRGADTAHVFLADNLGRVRAWLVSTGSGGLNSAAR